MTDRKGPSIAASRLKVSAWLPAEQDATEAEVERLIDDPNFEFAEKMNGMHVIVHRLESGIVTTNRKGEISKEIPAAILKEFEKLPPCIIAGEYLDRLAAFAPFDFIRYEALDLRPLPYLQRRSALFNFTKDLGPRIVRIRYAVTPEHKRDLLAVLRAEYAEGIVAKDLRAPYSERRLPAGGPFLRFKFWKECDVIVRRRTTDTTRSFDCFVFDNEGEIVNVGSVSAYDYYDRLEPGGATVARVSYLYSTPNNLLYGPPKIEEFDRADKDPKECSLSQLVLGKRFRRSA
jgi:ATP-dependent DNA ligase